MNEGVVTPIINLPKLPSILGGVSRVEQTLQDNVSSDQHDKSVVITDLLDLSDQARSALGNEQTVLNHTDEGRGRMALEEVGSSEEQLTDLQNQLDSLKILIEQKGSDQKEAVYDTMAAIEESAIKLGAYVGSQKPEKESFPKEFNLLLKGYSETFREVQEYLNDEDRFPPALSTLIKDLSAVSEYPQNEHLDRMV